MQHRMYKWNELVKKVYCSTCRNYYVNKYIRDYTKTKESQPVIDKYKPKSVR
jgi:hypothetical protein